MAIEFKKNQIMSTSGQFQQKGQTSRVSSSASQNIRKAAHTSIFSLNKPHGSNWVAGQKGSVDVRKADYTAARFSHNDRVFVPRGPIGPSYAPPTVVKSSSSYNTAATWTIVGNLINNTFGMLNKLGVIGNTQNTTKSAVDQLEPKGAGAGSLNSSVVASSINDMKAASNSMALSSCIQSAEIQYQNMDGQTQTLQNNITTAKANQAAITQRKGVVQSSITDIETKMNELKTKGEQCINKLEGNVDKAKIDRQNALDEITKADATYGKAVENVALKKDAVSTAQQEVDSLTASLGQVNSDISQLKSALAGLDASSPEYARVSAQLQAAEQRKAQIEQKLDTAKTNLDRANNELQNAENELQTAKDNLGARKDAFEALEQNLEEKQKALDDANRALSEKKAEYAKLEQQLIREQDELAELNEQEKAVENAQNALDTHLQDMETLKSEILEQRERLAKMQREEQKEIEKLTRKNETLSREINELNTKYDFNDSATSDKEREALTKRNEKQAELNANLARINEIQSNMLT